MTETKYQRDCRKQREQSRTLNDRISEQYKIASRLYRRWLKNNSFVK